MKRAISVGNGPGWLAVAVAVGVGAADVGAQQTGTITGRVTDDGGTAMSGAQVVVTNQHTGAQAGGLAAADGRYSVTGVRAGGPYLVDVRMIGFGRQAVEGVTITAGQTVTLDFRLTQEAIAIDALEVFATRAQERRRRSRSRT